MFEYLPEAKPLKHKTNRRSAVLRAAALLTAPALLVAGCAKSEEPQRTINRQFIDAEAKAVVSDCSKAMNHLLAHDRPIGQKPLPLNYATIGNFAIGTVIRDPGVNQFLFQTRETFRSDSNAEDPKNIEVHEQSVEIDMTLGVDKSLSDRQVTRVDVFDNFRVVTSNGESTPGYHDSSSEHRFEISADNGGWSIVETKFDPNSPLLPVTYSLVGSTLVNDSDIDISQHSDVSVGQFLSNHQEAIVGAASQICASLQWRSKS